LLAGSSGGTRRSSPKKTIACFHGTAAAGSAASFAFGGPAPSVGASGAIFGLCGVLVAVSAVHRPVLDRRGRAIMSQIGFLVVLNLIIGFGFGALLGVRIDNAAHVGGLLAGLWLGFVVPPIRSTLASYWQRPAPSTVPGTTSGGPLGAPSSVAHQVAAGRLPVALQWLAVAAVPVATAVLLAVGGATF